MLVTNYGYTLNKICINILYYTIFDEFDMNIIDKNRHNNIYYIIYLIVSWEMIIRNEYTISVTLLFIFIF